MAAATAPYTVTITGFDYLADKIQVTAGSVLPAADPTSTATSTPANGAVDLVWISNGNTVTIKLTGMSAASKNFIAAGLANIYTTY